MLTASASSSNSKENDLRRVADGAGMVLPHPPPDAPPVEAIAAAEHVRGLLAFGAVGTVAQSAAVVLAGGGARDVDSYHVTASCNSAGFPVATISAGVNSLTAIILISSSVP